MSDYARARKALAEAGGSPPDPQAPDLPPKVEPGVTAADPGVPVEDLRERLAEEKSVADAAWAKLAEVTADLRVLLMFVAGEWAASGDVPLSMTGPYDRLAAFCGVSHLRRQMPPDGPEVHAAGRTGAGAGSGTGESLEDVPAADDGSSQ